MKCDEKNRNGFCCAYIAFFGIFILSVLVIFYEGGLEMKNILIERPLERQNCESFCENNGYEYVQRSICECIVNNTIEEYREINGKYYSG